MKNLRNIFLLILLSALSLTSCHEWDPVTHIGWDYPLNEEIYELEPNITIKDLKALYTDGKPLHIEKDYIIGGQIISSDQAGNVYRSFYIQDETGGIEIKIGLSGLYNDYQLGRWVFVKLQGLTLGSYEGMLQVGLEDPTGEYETAYMDVKYIINQHIFKGKRDEPVEAVEISENEIRLDENMGKYVTLKNLTYGNQIFCLMYPNLNGDKKSTSNRIFLSDQTWGVTTWAMSANKMEEYLNSGVWDLATLADGSQTVAQLRAKNAIEKSANYVSHYFRIGQTTLQVRTSGYSKFADTELDKDVLNGQRTVNLTGILSNYRGDPQFTLIDIEGVKLN